MRTAGEGSDEHLGHGGNGAPGEHGQHGDHAAHDEHAGHSVDMFERRFYWSLLLTIPIVVTSEMVMDWFGYELGFPGREWIGPVLGTILYAWGGAPFLKGGVQEARERAPGMMLLIAMAITVAYVASLATSLGAFDLDFWWELAALVTIMLAGHWQEMKALGQAQDALAALAALLPDEAERITDRGSTETVAVADLTLGDLVLVRSGSRIPADGEITEGAAELDESMITGESRPVSKAAGEQVVAGTISTDSSLRVRVTAVGDDDSRRNRPPGAPGTGITFAVSGVGGSCGGAALLCGNGRCADHGGRLVSDGRDRHRRSAGRHRARDLLPACTWACDTAHHRDLEFARGQQRDSGQKPAGA